MPLPRLLRCGNWRINTERIELVETACERGRLVVRVYLTTHAVQLEDAAAAALLRWLHEDAPGGPTVTVVERRDAA